MTEEAIVRKAQQDPQFREQLIRESIPFICRCASVTLKRRITAGDDAFSTALGAFNEALSAYVPEKGAFRGFAAVCIRNALVSELRTQSRHAASIPMSSLSSRTEDGKERPFDAEDPADAFGDLSAEVLSLRLELSAYGIAFTGLPAASPKTEKTRRLCRAAAHYVASDGDLLQKLRRTGRLPFTDLIAELPEVGKKLLERHRVYIIAGILICAGDYPALKTYFEGKERIR